MMQQLVNGVSLGAIYALVGLGYALVFGMLRVVNLAYGQIMMVGAFSAYFVSQLSNSGILAIILGGVVGAVIAGMLVHLIAVKPLGNVSDVQSSAHMAALITTIGAAIFLQNTALQLTKSQDRSLPELISQRPIELWSISATPVQCLIIFSVLILMFIIRHAIIATRWGLAVRTVAENVTAAESLGMPVRRLQAQVVILSSALAGVAAVLVAIQDRTITPFFGASYGIKGLTALLVGGLGSIPGAVAAGFTLGLVEVLAVAYLSETYRDTMSYGALLAVVLLRPQGILGRVKLRH